VGGNSETEGRDGGCGNGVAEAAMVCPCSRRWCLQNGYARWSLTKREGVEVNIVFFCSSPSLFFSGTKRSKTLTLNVRVFGHRSHLDAGCPSFAHPGDISLHTTDLPSSFKSPLRQIRGSGTRCGHGHM
jgi:hypothetical protein